MMPSPSGKSLTIAPGDSLTESQEPDTFHLINPDSCQIVAFVQNYQTKEIYQGAKIRVRPAQKPQPGIQNQREDKVYNVNGELVYNLTKRYNRGAHQIFWDGGEFIPQGIYFISLKTSGYKAIRKVVVLRR